MTKFYPAVFSLQVKQYKHIAVIKMIYLSLSKVTVDIEVGEIVQNTQSFHTFNAFKNAWSARASTDTRL